MDSAGKLSVCVGLTSALVVAELVLGHFSHCLTLLTVTNQSLYNLLTLVCALLAKKLESRARGRPSDGFRSTFGWARIEVVGSLSSLVFLGSLCFSTSIECLQTLFHSDHLDAMHQPEAVGILAGAHFIVWLVVFFLVGGYTYQQSSVIDKSTTGSISLKIPSKMHKNFLSGHLRELHSVPTSYIFRDLAGCFLQLCLSLVHVSAAYGPGRAGQGHEDLLQQLKYIDPFAGLLAILIQMASSYTICKESCLILLQTIPDELNVEQLKDDLFRKFPAILNIHELHVWCLVPTQIVATMHIIFPSEQNYLDQLQSLEDYLSQRGVTTWTIQPEIFNNDGNTQIIHERFCMLKCKKQSCAGCCLDDT